MCDVPLGNCRQSLTLSHSIQFVRGDMYVTDQARTSGHTAGVTGVDWHPLERDVVLTSSMDGSARIWNLNGKTQFHMLVCDKVYRAKNVKGQRVGVTAVAFHPGGREFVLGTACGSIQIWNATRVGARPERVVYHSHGEGRPVNSLSYNVDGSQIVSRSSQDDKVKVWDARRLSRSCKPVELAKDFRQFTSDPMLSLALTAAWYVPQRVNIKRDQTMNALRADP